MQIWLRFGGVDGMMPQEGVKSVPVASHRLGRRQGLSLVSLLTCPGSPSGDFAVLPSCCWDRVRNIRLSTPLSKHLAVSCLEETLGCGTLYGVQLRSTLQRTAKSGVESQAPRCTVLGIM